VQQLFSTGVLLCFASAVFAAETPAKVPTFRAHSHNDDLHVRPLADALAHGFRSVEADVWLTNGFLLVAHDFDKTSQERTLQKLYLDPLRAFVKTNVVMRSAASFTLLIDVKSDAELTYAALRDVLANYADILTRFESNTIHTNAVVVIVSGNRAETTMRLEPSRWAAVDGRLPDLERNPIVALVPLISDNWTKQFKWRGVGAMPPEERALLRALVTRAHGQRRWIRLWAAPDNEAAWKELSEARVDLLNTDKLADMETFMRSRK
jgi:hypothetical protein